MSIFSNGKAVRNITANSRESISGIDDVALRKIKERVNDIGYAVISDVIDRELILDIRALYFGMFTTGFDRVGNIVDKEEFEALMRGYGSNTHPSLLIQESIEYKSLINSANLKDIAKYLSEEEVRVLKYMVLRTYNKFSNSTTMAHFDEIYVSNPPRWMSNFWIPLGEASAETGTIAYLPRSHRLPLYQLRGSYHQYCGIKPKGGYPFGDNLDEISAYLNEAPWEYVELEPGSVVVHHPRVLHCGTDSFSEYCRLSTDIRFAPVSWLGDNRWDEQWNSESMKKWPTL